MSYKNYALAFFLSFAFFQTSLASVSHLPDGIDFAALEETYPTHFKGFSSTPFETINLLRDLKEKGQLKYTTHSPKLKPLFEDLSKKLSQHTELSAIKGNVDKILEHPEHYTLLRYIFVISQIATAQGKGFAEETNFFNGVGFSMPYGLITALDLSNGFSNYEEFLSALELMEEKEDKDTRGDFFHLTDKRYHDRADRMDNEYVEKGPFSAIPCFLPGEDVLGFFYLAWTYAQGLHPVPTPLKATQAKLHGISMSRFAQICHDLAHSKADTSDHSAEQFGHYLLNHHSVLVKTHAKDLTLADRSKFGIKSMLPHYATFAMTVHNLYRQSLVDILNASLTDMAPDSSEFQAFSTASLVALHEEPVDLSRAYRVGNLQDLLRASVPEQPENNEEGESGLICETTFLTGESPLSNEEIFDRVKKLKLSRFLRDYDLLVYGDTPLIEEEIAEYEVKRNPFYIEVKITMVDGQEHLFRETTNFAAQLNFEHDLTILKAMETVLARDYQYDLPVIPSQKDFKGEAEFAKAAKACGQALDLGRLHTRDIFVKTALRLCEKKESIDATSIAERFSEGYSAAISTLKAHVPDFIDDVQDFIDEACASPDAEDEDL